MTCRCAGCARRAKYAVTFDWPRPATTTVCSDHHDDLRSRGWTADLEHRLEAT